MNKLVFSALLIEKDGIIKGPFGGDIKKSLFVSKSDSCYKVYEQGVVLNSNVNYGDYYIAEEHFKKSLSRFEVKQGDILMTGAGTLGELFVVPRNHPKGVINQALLRLRLDENVIDKIYFKYFFKFYIKSNVSNINGDSVIPNLPPLTVIKNIPVQIPKLSEQQKIARVLSSLDDKIELNNKINAELEAMAKTLYNYWFVQFDFPDANGKPYKSSGGKMAYNLELKRDIPKGWEVKRLGDTCRTYLGGTPPTKNKEYWQGTIPWLNSGEADFPIISTEQLITKEAIDNSATKLLPKGTVLLSITRHLRPNILGIDACVNQSVVGITESKKLKSSYLYLYITKEIPRLMTLRTGAQQPHINKEMVDDSLIIIPSEITITKFYSIAEPIFEKIILNAKQNQTLASLRDWLLPMLINGQVTVNEAYKIAEEKMSMVAEEKSTI